MKLFFSSRLRGATSAFISIAVIAALFAPTGYAGASEDVGVAVTVRNEVTGKIQAQTVKVDNGSNVFGREIVRTGPDSSAKIVLKDNTNLNVGPSSSVTLDSFVFQGESDYKQAGFNLAKGAFRFTSGGSDKRAYDLKTPVAIIGVRGTDFVVIVKDKTSHIEVKEGRTVICPAKAPANQPVLPKVSEDEKKRCRKDDRANDELAGSDHDRRRESECCRKGCTEVNEGEAVDVTASCVFSSQFTNANVGEGQMSFAEASGMGVGGLSIPAMAVGAVGAAAGVAGGIAGSNNNQPPNNSIPIVPPNKPKPPSGE